MSRIYRVVDISTGLYVQKRSGSSGFRWAKTGTIWRTLAHIKCSLKQGVLHAARQRGGNLRVLEYEVKELPVGSFPIGDLS